MIPRTGPSHDTVPVSPPEVNVPDEGTTENPGASVIVDENVQCVWGPVLPPAPAAVATPDGPVSSTATRTVTTETGRLPMPWTVTYGDAPDQAGGSLRPPPRPHGPRRRPAPPPARPRPRPAGRGGPAGAARRGGRHPRRRRGPHRQPAGRGAGAPLPRRPARQRAQGRDRRRHRRPPGGDPGRRDRFGEEHPAAQDLPRGRPGRAGDDRPHAAPPAGRPGGGR